VVLVYGETGVGKWTLVSQALKQFEALISASVSCSLNIVRRPMEPWRLLLAQLERSGYRPPVGLQLPSGTEPLDDELFHQTACQLAEWLGSLSTPVVLMLQDVHWGDAASLAFLQHLRPRLESLPVLVLATYVRGLPHSGPRRTLLDEILAEKPLDIPVDRMQECDVQTLVAERFPNLPNRAQEASRLFRETNGWPILISLILEKAKRIGHIPDELPKSIRLCVQFLCKGLPDFATHVLRSAAVIGEEFDVSLLEAVSALESCQVDEALDQLQELGLIGPSEESHKRRFDSAAIHRTVLRDMRTSTLNDLKTKVEKARAAAGHLGESAEIPARNRFGNSPEAARLYLRSGQEHHANPSGRAEAALEYERGLQAIDEHDPLYAELSLLLGHVRMPESPEQARKHWTTALSAALEHGDQLVAVLAVDLLLRHWPSSPGSKGIPEFLLMGKNLGVLRQDARFKQLGALVMTRPKMTQPLTKTEKQTVNLRLLNDMSNSEIASALYKSEKTVRKQLEDAQKKIPCKTTDALVEWGRQHWLFLAVTQDEDSYVPNS
jgi:DNA-binding CsgD family transcriptional regulator